MSDYFQPFLVNPLTADPVLFVKLFDEKRALLVDCGDTSRLSNKNLQTITHIFISHTHIDHFIGFDRVLRANVGLAKTLRVFGPAGISRQVHNKVLAYTWNLLGSDDLQLLVCEIEPGKITQIGIFPGDRFTQRHTMGVRELQDGIIHDDNRFYVSCAQLDHKIPSLAYAFIEKNSWRVDKAKLSDFGHAAGPWVGALKILLSQGVAADRLMVIDGREYRVSELKERLLEEVKGQKIAYVTDVLYTPATSAAVVELAKDADLFYCESHFAQQHLVKARASYHLTTTHAGLLARQARVKKVIGFHYSPRYTADKQHILEEQLQEAFTQVDDPGGEP